ncbi:MAG: PAS domain S-box protein [Anaerolineae bacterium]|nr:PAS domain S-box protein [Anaerolineae bacterium]
MSDNRRALTEELERARRELQTTQRHITELENQLDTTTNTTANVGSLQDDLNYAALDNLLEGFQLIGYDWRYLFVNQAAARHNNCTPADLIGRTMMECFPDVEHTPVFAVLQQCMADRRVVETETEILYSDGSKRWFELHIQPQQTGLFILTLDITERKAQEKMLHRYAQRMEILHQLDLGIVGSKSIDEVVNHALKHMLGLFNCQQIGVSLFDFATNTSLLYAANSLAPSELVVGERYPIYPQFLTNFGADSLIIIDDLLQHPAATSAYKRITSDGMRSSLQSLIKAQDRPLGVLYLNADTPTYFTDEHRQLAVEITKQLAVAIQQRHLSEALRESEHRYRTVVEDQSDFICRYRPDLTVTFVNRAFSAAHQTTPEAMVGRNLKEIIPAPYFASFLAHVEKLAASTSIVTFESPFRLPDGSLRWIQWQDRVLRDDTGRLIEYQGVGRDITERRQMEEELKALYNATSYLFKADNLPTLGQQIVEAVVKEFAQVDCGLLLVDEPQNSILRLSRGGSYDIQPATPLRLDSQGLVPLAIRMGETVYVPDVTHDEHYIPSVKSTRSELVIPLKTSRGVLGVLDLQHTKVDAFSPRDQRILTAYAERAAAAVESMQLYETLDQHAVELEQHVSERTAELQSTKDRVEAILHNSPNAILLVKRDLSIQQANLSFNYLFKTSDSLQIKVTDLVHTDDVALVERTIQEGQLEGHNRTIEVCARRSDATTFEAELSIGIIRGDGFVCTFRDITERKRADAALRDSEERFRQYFELPLIGIAITSPDKGWLQVNDKLCDMLGYTREELIYTTWAEITHPDDLIIDVTQFDRVLAGESEGYSIDKRYVRKNGSVLQTTITARAVRNPNGQINYFMALVQDITERKQAETALRESEERYRLLADNATDMVIRLSMQGECLYISPSIKAILGYEPDELVGQSVLNFVHADDFAPLANLLMFGEQPANPKVLYRGLHKQGHYIWLEAVGQIISSTETGTPIEIISSSRNVSDRLHAEEALRESEERFRSIVNGILDYSICMLNPDGNILSWNTGAERIKGYSALESLGQNFSRSFTPEDQADGLPQQILETARSGNHYMGESWQLRKDGSRFWASIILSALRDKDGKLIGFTKVISDVTERKKTEETLQLALSKEKELSELKTRFVSMASHEFRTPLATILTITESLTYYWQKMKEDQIQQRLGRIQEQISYLTEIMDDVLQLARLQARRAEYNPVLLDLTTLCQHVIDEFTGRQDITNQIAFVYEDSLPQLKLDRKLMRQILNNLISNAIKYSPQASTVTIKLTHVDSTIVLKVSDRGIGIPQSDLDYLFEPFHRASNVGTIAGTGLGLTIMKESVELHGGTIRVESQVDVGTTFTITLPVHFGNT